MGTKCWGLWRRSRRLPGRDRDWRGAGGRGGGRRGGRAASALLNLKGHSWQMCVSRVVTWHFGTSLPRRHLRFFLLSVYFNFSVLGPHACWASTQPLSYILTPSSTLKMKIFLLCPSFTWLPKMPALLNVKKRHPWKHKEEIFLFFYTKNYASIRNGSIL